MDVARQLTDGREKEYEAQGMENGEACTVGSSEDSGWCLVRRWAEAFFPFAKRAVQLLKVSRPAKYQP